MESANCRYGASDWSSLRGANVGTSGELPSCHGWPHIPGSSLAALNPSAQCLAPTTHGPPTIESIPSSRYYHSCRLLLLFLLFFSLTVRSCCSFAVASHNGTYGLFPPSPPRRFRFSRSCGSSLILIPFSSAHRKHGPFAATRYSTKSPTFILGTTLSRRLCRSINFFYSILT